MKKFISLESFENCNGYYKNVTFYDDYAVVDFLKDDDEKGIECVSPVASVRIDYEYYEYCLDNIFEVIQNLSISKVV